VQAAGIHHLELTVLFLVLLVAGLATLAQRFNTPYPIVLFVGGVALSLLPGLPRIALNPMWSFWWCSLLSFSLEASTLPA